MDLRNKIISINYKLLKPQVDNIINTITSIFKISENQIEDIKEMKSGMTNVSFLFSVLNKTYVFRVSGLGSDLLIKRNQEAIIYNKIKPLKISDEVVYFDEKTGYKITKFYQDIKVIDPYNQKQVALAINKLKELHDSNLSVDFTFEISEQIDYHYNLCKSVNIKFNQEFKENFKMVNKLLAYISNNKNADRLCHIDPVSSNFLYFQDDSLKLIDWEYSANSDYIIDLAMFSVAQVYSKKQVDFVINTYFENNVLENNLKLYYAYISLVSFLWYLWTLYKEKLGEDFGDYKDIKFNYFLKYYDNFSNLNIKELKSYKYLT